MVRKKFRTWRMTAPADCTVRPGSRPDFTRPRRYAGWTVHSRTVRLSMGTHWVALLGLFGAGVAWAQDPREIVRRSIAEDQLDWTRMKDYTWQAQSLEKHFGSNGTVQSTKQEKWESLILDGQPLCVVETPSPQKINGFRRAIYLSHVNV